MPKIEGGSIRRGNVLEHNGGLWVVVKTEHVKPGKGGAFAQVEMKNVRDGRKLNERFRSADKVERVRLDAETSAGGSRVGEILSEFAPTTGIPLSAFFNSGSPDLVNGRHMYLKRPDYLASMAEKLVDAGVNLIGGCCGTTPDHIRAIADAVAGKAPRKIPEKVRRMRLSGLEMFETEGAA